MKSEAEVKKTIRKSELHVNERVHQGILGDAMQRLETVTCKLTAGNPPGLWRLIMPSRIAKSVVAAAILLTAGISIILLNKSVPSAYAIEQTIEASHSVQTLHMRAITLSHEDQPVEFWIEFAPDGQPKNMRLNLPDWMAPGSGPREVIWQDNQIQEWLPDKNSLMTRDDTISPAQVRAMIENMDPKLAVTRLQEKQTQGKVELEINETSGNDQLILITATSTPADNSSFQRMVLTVDPTTKLVHTIALYKLQNGAYEHIKTLEYHDYNQPIDASFFAFRDVPPDGELLDLNTVGLAQGALSQEDIATKVVRTFLESIIAKEFDKASRLLPGVPSGTLSDMFSNVNVVRIVSLDKPIRDTKTGGLRVPFEVEISEAGKTTLLTHNGPLVQQLAGRNGRWSIISLD